jgi:peptide/nickel transport system substrate-binding protein
MAPDGTGADRPTTHTTRRDFLRWSGGIAASAGLLGGGGALLDACGGGGGQGQSGNAGQPKKGGHVTEGWFSDIKTFNSTLSSDVYSSLCIGLCFDGLLNVDAKGNLIPGLAQSVPSVGSDQNTYEFKLRPNLKWSDGQPLTSDDVLFTYNLFFAPQYEVVNSPRRGDFTAHVASISAPDPQTFVIKTKHPYGPTLPTHGLYGVLPKHVLGSIPPAGINTADFNTAPTVCSGVFKFVKWVKGAQITFERNPTYWGGQSRLDGFVYKVVSSTVQVANQLKTGEIDVGQIDASQLSAIQATHGITVDGFATPSFSFYMYQLDPTKPAGQIFQDVNVRQALLYATDRAGIVKTAVFGQGEVANSVEPPTSWAWNKNTKPTYPHDPDKANKMLESAGWVKGPDGIRAKGGKRLAFTIQGIAGSTPATNTMQIMQQNWKQVGVELTPKSVQFDQIVTAITDTRDFDLILVGFNFGSDPDESQLFSSAGTRPGGFNGFDFKNAEADRLQTQAAASIDRATRKQLYFQYQNLMAQLVPAPVLYFQKFNWGLAQRVQGYGLGPFNQYGNRPWMKDVWVTDSK